MRDESQVMYVYVYMCVYVCVYVCMYACVYIRALYSQEYGPSRPNEAELLHITEYAYVQQSVQSAIVRSCFRIMTHHS